MCVRRGRFPLVTFVAVDSGRILPLSMVGCLLDATLLVRQIGAKVRERRLAHGLTQRELAKRARVSERLVRDLETGVAMGIGIEKLVGILDVLDIGLVLEGEDGFGASPVDDGSAYTALLEQAMSSWDGIDGGV